MMTRLVWICLALLCIQLPAQAQTVLYEHEFATDPGWQLSWTPDVELGEFAGIQEGSYRLRAKETVGSTNKWAYSPTFALVDGTSGFLLTADIMVAETSWGFPQQLFLTADHDDPWNSSKVSLHFRGSEGDYRVLLVSGNGDQYEVGRYDVGVWYTYTAACEFDGEVGTADVSMIERATGQPVAELTDLPFTPAAFDRIYLGEHTINGDGDWGELRLDNLTLESGAVRAEHWSLSRVKALFQ